MVLKKSGRGSVGRMTRERERYATDKEFREKRKERKKIYHKKNREKELNRHRKWVKELSEFANKKCKKCGKLLEYRTKGEYCRKHNGIGRKKKK